MRGYLKRISQKASKMSKEQILTLLDDMVEENEHLYAILESISAGLLIVDNDFYLLQNNKIIETFLPFSIHTDDIKAASYPIWDIVDDEEISSYFKKCSENEITNSCEEFTTMTSGGTIRFISITISPLIQKNELKGRIIVITDITDSKNQQVMLHRMEKMSTLTNLAAGMAHEIKNPLGAISIHIQLVQKALIKARENQNILPPKKFVEDHIDVVNEEVDHLNKLIMDFLMAVRPVKAVLELKNPYKLIKDICNFFEPEFNKEGVEVVLESKVEDKRVLLDEKLFRDVILNLSQNSLAAIKSRFPDLAEKRSKGEFLGKLVISCFASESKYVINVNDNGCGMSDETLSKVFEPYYTTKANGTGLGMTTVYKIIKEFAGEILAQSQENVGTTFSIILPLPQKNTKLLGSKEV